MQPVFHGNTSRLLCAFFIVFSGDKGQMVSSPSTSFFLTKTSTPTVMGWDICYGKEHRQDPAKGMHPSTDKQPRMFASFFLICSQLPEISPKNRKTNVKMAQKGLKTASKRGQSDSKTTPTLCQNDAKTMPNDPWVTPKWPGIDPKTVQNHTKMMPFRSQNSPKNGPDRVKNGTEKLTKGQK